MRKDTLVGGFAMKKILPLLVFLFFTGAKEEKEQETVKVFLKLPSTVEVRAYCCCEKCCGKWAKVPKEERKTAAKKPLYVDGVFQKGIAVPKEGPIPYFTRISIPGYGNFEADDTGGWMNRKWEKEGRFCIEVRFEDHEEAVAWGAKKLPVSWSILVEDSEKKDRKEEKK